MKYTVFISAGTGALVVIGSLSGCATDPPQGAFQFLAPTPASSHSDVDDDSNESVWDASEVGDVEDATIARPALCAPVGEVGVCCRRGLSCDETGRAECVGQGGTWLDGESCPSTRCVVNAVGACCLPDCSCNRLSATEFTLGNQFDECAGIGGYYLGNGTSCTTNPCRAHP